MPTYTDRVERERERERKVRISLNFVIMRYWLRIYFAFMCYSYYYEPFKIHGDVK